jgi:regulation of enolase protein 1 (concanavalin A-like superfamily)
MRSHNRALLGAALLVCTATTAAVAQTLPTPWNSTDVGSPALRGNVSFGSDRFTVNGGGTDIGGTADQFYFVYRPLSSDGEIVARVESLTRTDNQAKAGVMIREALTPDSRYAMMTITASKGHRFLRRPNPGDMSISSSSVSGGAPGWVKLARAGDTFVASWSTDGVTWTTVGTDTIPMGDTVYVGLAVASRDRRRLARGVFSNVKVTSSSSGNQSPAVTITSPTNGTQYSLPLPSALTITASATDSEDRLASVGFYVNNTLLATDTTAPYSVPWSPSAAGTYTLGAMVQDADGGSSWSSSVTVTVGATNGSPTVALTSPANGATFTAPATIGLAATASDAEGPIARVEFYSGTTLLWTETSLPYADSWTNVAAGTYTLTAVAYDGQGARTTSAPVTVTVNSPNGAPAVTLTSPANGWTSTAPATINFAASASDPENQLSRVEFYSGTTLRGTDTTAPYTFSWSNVAAGTYTLTAKAFDGAGMQATSAAVTVTVSANGAPTVTLTSPANGATFAAPAIINLAANASDPENQLARVEFYSGTTLLGTDTIAPYTFSWGSVAAGTYTLTAKAFDAAGGQATSAAVSVVVGSVITPPTAVVFTASADHATNVTSYRLSIYAPGANPATATPIATSDLGKPTPAANNDITVDRATFFAALAVGNYVATVTAIGPGGQTQSSSVAFSR